MKNKIIAIIPARGGSKGVPRKNLRLLCGKPLIYYTIREALKSKHISKTIVSTEDEEVVKTSNEYGAEVIKRPIELAKDETPTIDVIFHVLQVVKAQNFEPKIVVLLQPTSPLRNAQDIDNAIELFLENDCESVVSVCEIEHSPYWSFKIENGYLTPIFGEEYLRKRRQDLPKVYIPNGAIYVSTPEVLCKYRSFYCQKTIPYIMPPERSVDIDNEIDFMLAELLMMNYGLEKYSKLRNKESGQKH